MEDFEKAIANEVKDLIDYRMLALAVLSQYDLDALVSRIAENHALDILEGT